MGILDALFGPGKTPTPKRIASQVEALKQRHGDPSFRYVAADTLAGWGTPEAIAGLLDRYTMNVASETSDEAEKAYVAELLVDKLGRAAVEPIEAYLRHHEQVSWPLRILGKIVEGDELRERCVRVLSRLDTHFDRLPERKVELLRFLLDHAGHDAVADAAQRFLEDTDDRVRIQAIELLATAGRPADLAAMVACLLESADRPRVGAALCEALAGRKGALAGHVEAATPALSAGYTISKDGTLSKVAGARKA